MSSKGWGAPMGSSGRLRPTGVLASVLPSPSEPPSRSFRFDSSSVSLLLFAVFPSAFFMLSFIASFAVELGHCKAN